MIRDYASELAKRGFVAVVPSYLQRTWTSQPTREEVFATMGSHRDEWQETIGDAITHAQTKLPGIDASRVGLLGFSLGGHLCLRLWSTPKVLVAFFAPTLPQLGRLGPRGPLTTHIQIQHGKADSVVSIKDGEAILQELKNNRPVPEHWFYDDAGHGFISSKFGGTDLGNSNAREQSRKNALTFFQSHL
jgi:dienelactone hydrolase